MQKQKQKKNKNLLFFNLANPKTKKNKNIVVDPHM